MGVTKSDETKQKLKDLKGKEIEHAINGVADNNGEKVSIKVNARRSFDDRARCTARVRNRPAYKTVGVCQIRPSETGGQHWW